MTAPDGIEHKLALYGSPRSVDAAVTFTRQNCRRLLERIGIDQNRGVQGQANHHRPKGPPPRRALVLSFERPQLDAGPYRDTWAVLREGQSASSISARRARERLLMRPITVSRNPAWSSLSMCPNARMSMACLASSIEGSGSSPSAQAVTENFTVEHERLHLMRPPENDSHHTSRSTSTAGHAKEVGGLCPRLGPDQCRKGPERDAALFGHRSEPRRPSKFDPAVCGFASSLRSQGHAWSFIAAALGVSAPTLAFWAIRYPEFQTVYAQKAAPSPKAATDNVARNRRDPGPVVAAYRSGQTMRQVAAR